MDASADFESKARHLRALYREHGEAGYPHVRAAHERLFPTGDTRLDQILANAWQEGRKLAGQSYDYAGQCWRDREGARVD